MNTFRIAFDVSFVFESKHVGCIFDRRCDFAIRVRILHMGHREQRLFRETQPKIFKADIFSWKYSRPILE